MKTALFLLTGVLAVAAQTANSVQASGTATISVTPDMATINVGVVTQAATAQQAADQNASAADAMIKALQAVLGNAGTIQTIAYSLDARYTTASANSTPVLTGYAATNTVQVKMNNVGLIGPIIDAGNRAGANTISGPSFGLQNPEPQKLQALTSAAKDAMGHAAAVAAGLGLKTGAVISAQEGVTVTPIVTGTAGAAASSTPILNGTVTVTANVTVAVGLVP